MDLSFGPLLSTFVLGICTLLLLYWYGTRKHDYWKKLGILYVKPLPFVGNMVDVFREQFHEVELKRYKQFGRIYGHFEGNKPLLNVADPKLLREILVKDFPSFTSRRVYNTGNEVVDSMLTIVRGEDWKRIRSIITPSFSTGKIKRMLSIFKDCANAVGNNFKSESGKPVDVKRLYGAFTMDVIASSAFSTKIDSHNDPDNEFVKAARNAFSPKITWPIILFFLLPRMFWVLSKVFVDKGPMQFFTRVTHEIVEERKKTGKGRNDFLQLLMDCAKDVSAEHNWNLPENEKGDIDSNYGQDASSHSIFKSVSSKHLSMNELVAQCIVFFLAGYDTTASTLSLVSYLLAMNPDIQDKLRIEVDEALQATGGELTYEAIQNMKYMDNVISETLRLYPPGARLERVADEDYKLGDTGITILKGMMICVPVFAMQRDPENFPDPERFDPDRFTAEERAKRDQYTYLPFGAGPRNCLGMRFALIEIKVCLAHVISNFIIKRCPQTKVPLDLKSAQQGLLQIKELILEMESRKVNPLTL